MLKNVWKVLVIVILMGALGAAGYFYYQYRQASGLNGDKEVKKYVTLVGKVMILPDEVPTLATVTDVTKLINQRFFKSAQNGDKVLIYPLASKAILFRPMLNKIVEVASVLPVDQSLTNPASANTELTQSQVQIISGGVAGVALYNGTETVGLTNKLEKTILDKIKDIEIKLKETAIRKDYQRTIVIDLTGKFPAKVEELSKLLDAKVTTLPSGEARPDADVVIILGKSSI
jgi:hypothetical protein